ncbi:MAG TPA: CHAT domain-containing protein [Draconibacterium sp.]|nr:CHAT domain-containing protein [Draconibacterium sp.]
MSKTQKYIYLTIIILHPLFCQSQNQNYISDSIQSVILNKKAIELLKNGLYTKALDPYFQSLELRKKLYGKLDPKLAATYSGIGIIYGRLGQLDLALQYYKLAEVNYLSAKSPLYWSIFSLYNNIGIIYRFKLDFDKALQYFNQALTLSVTELNAPPEDIARINYNIAEIYYLTNNYKKAIELINNNINNSYIEDKKLYYELMAFIYQIQGEIKKSKQNYQKAIDLALSIYEQNSIDIAISYINYSNFLISIDQLSDADEVLKKAYLIIQDMKPVNGMALSEYYKTKGLIVNNIPVATQNIESFKNQRKKNLLEAINWFRKGLIPLNFTDNYLTVNALELNNLLSIKECIVLFKLIADDYNELAKLEQTNDKLILTESMILAIENYQVVGSLIQRARKEISDDKSKIELNTLEYATFNQIIDISYTAYSITKDFKYLEQAFQNSERLKSSSLFDKISNQLALKNSLVPDSLLNLEYKLNSSIIIYSEKLNNEKNSSNPDSSLIKEYNNEIFTANREREELQRKIETDYKDFYNLKYSNSMLSLKDIQLKLHKDEVILEYVFNETDSIHKLYVFAISSDNIEFNRLKLNADFNSAIEFIFRFMSNTEYMFTKNEDSKQFCVSSNLLYKQLILPLKDRLINKKITIVPDGKLSYIPFDALLENLPDTSKNIEFNQLDYLIRKYCINYSNSVNLLFSQISTVKKNKSEAIAFAPIYKEGESIEISNKKYPLIPLPGVEKEVAGISKIISADIFSGEDATEDNFRKNAEKYDILHLAMHAFINDSLPANSSFAFTQIETEDPAKDGMLNTADIYNLKLQAKLTVLSACNTGSGQLKKGEGIMSLARGFIYAGCPSIIMSLWEVEDESGTQIITSLYKNIKKGKRKDESLRLAKLEYLNSVSSRRAHPHYWLGFVSIGDDSPLYKSYDFYFFIVLILALSGIGIDQTIRIKKARKKRAL